MIKTNDWDDSIVISFVSSETTLWPKLIFERGFVLAKMQDSVMCAMAGMQYDGIVAKRRETRSSKLAWSMHMGTNMAAVL